ncbi:BA14K family protein [Mesorhizobium sp. SP-1A]|uniref:BA14K family protein n=1 Tax=Mesorhizobium sp. SP-1A TaxID=3077840 RepID=UPI0028F6CD3E|nr:BA14K family protein [Mesorhizobium sp. SP-1A]
MKKLMSGLLAAAVGLSIVGGEVVAANAQPLYVPQKPLVSTDIQNVQYRGRERVMYRHGGYYWRGHRGYRHYRPGYRRHGDYWFPLAAFAAGAIISGAIANDRPPPPPPAAYGNSHVRWCSERYRSYRAYDNSWQPYNGPRRQCVSPYG